MTPHAALAGNRNHSRVGEVNGGYMALPLLRRGPRVTIMVDFNLQWLVPTIRGQDGMYYFHFGWLSGFIGFGRARDTFYDALDRGCGIERQ